MSKIEDWYMSVSDEAQAFWMIMILLVGVPAFIAGVAIATQICLH